MTLYSYTIAIDTGFAPNPFNGFCTLACCKPGIRRTAQDGDYVVGIGPKGSGNRVVYAMRGGLSFFRPSKETVPTCLGHQLDQFRELWHRCSG